MYSSTPQQRSAIALALVASLTVAGLIMTAPARAATATATASGTVIVAAVNLAFGSFAPGAGAGSVTVSTSGVRGGTGVVLTTGAPPSAARFNITGHPNATYAISYGGSSVLTNTTGGGNETMALTRFSDFSAANATSGEMTTGTLSPAGTQSLYVGATLSVAANQVAGVYTGTVSATVEYN